MKNFALLLVIACSSLLLKAQPKLTVSSAWTIPSDSVDWNGNPYYVDIGVVIENIGNAKLDGNVGVFMRYNNDTMAYIRGGFLAQDFEVGMQQQITFTDTITDISGARYKGGDNILVIWPQTDNPNVMIPDSAHLPIYINDVRLEAAEQLEVFRERVQIFPNPASTSLNLVIIGGASKFEYVRMIDAMGKEIFMSSSAVSSLPVQDLPAGIYFVEISFRDGVKGSFRVMMQ